MRSILFLLALMLTTTAYAGSYLNWQISYLDFKHKNKVTKIRAGFLKANPAKSFKGNVLYYQGLGDSMLNHDPLFEVLVNEGFRVIAFDYMGQGGSSGTMNHTTIKNINELGDQVIAKFKRGSGKYHLIGWSTGGLAAYRKAYFDQGKEIKSMALIAPGIAPNFLVGEGLFNWPIDEITLRTLTTNRFIGVNDPHEDPIHPKSPLYVPMFATNIQKVSLIARRKWTMPQSVAATVFLSGKNDTYVNAKKTKTTLKYKAPHFKIVQYPQALHEIDNEKEEIARDLRAKVLNQFK